GDLRILQQRLQRPEAEDLVEHLDDEILALLEVERNGLAGEQVVHRPADLRRDLVPIEGFEVREVQAFEQSPMDPSPDLDQLGPARLHARLARERLARPWRRTRRSRGRAGGLSRSRVALPRELPGTRPVFALSS